MKNIVRITENNVVPLLGEHNNPAFLVGEDELRALPDEEIVCEYPGTYCIRANEEYIFYSRTIIKKQKNRSNSGYNYYAACEKIRDGKKSISWICLNYFLLKDAYGNPIMPGWFGLGNMEARVKELIWRGGRVKSITKKVTLLKGGTPQVVDVGIIPWGEKEDEILTTIGLADTAVGDIILWDTPEDTISLMWTMTDKRIKFEAPQNLEKWPIVLSECIDFIRVVQGLRQHVNVLENRYFFKTSTKLLYGSRTFSITYNKNNYTISLNSGNSGSVFPPVGSDYEYLVNCSSLFREYLNDLIYKMQLSLPRGRAESLLEECKNRASLHSAKMKLLGEL